jgi:peroxiredoxin Q/BCP
MAKAKNFKLQNQDGEWIRLSDFDGMVRVVYFYPKAMTPGCTKQACGLRDSKMKLARREVKVFGLSADSVERLKKFTDKEKLNFDLLSDPDFAVAKAYESYGPKVFMGKKYDGILRKTYIIDGKGNLVHIMEKVNTATHHDDVLAWIDTNLPK